MTNSVRQTDSALSNFSLNTHGYEEVQKSKNFLKNIMSVSCNQPSYVEIQSNKRISKFLKSRQNECILMTVFITRDIWAKMKKQKQFFFNQSIFHLVKYNRKITRFKHSLLSEKLTNFQKYYLLPLRFLPKYQKQ